MNRALVTRETIESGLESAQDLRESSQKSITSWRGGGNFKGGLVPWGEGNKEAAEYQVPLLI